ncbi:MAG: hypothetical protein GY952_10220 [Rhodobacteraceae bacterium]|nr:hypothetical protein [Paracoccaceae bacterium]
MTNQDQDKPIAWIQVVSETDATGDLAQAYSAVRGKDGKVENLYLAMSQTPAAIGPADRHYRALLHNPDSPLEPWLAEYLATFVAILCGSDYAARNHGENFRHFLSDDERAGEMLAAARDNTWRETLEGTKLRAAVRYAWKLSVAPERISQDDIQELRKAGFCEKGISYIVQIVASFAYWARMINGLGIAVGDTVGLAGKHAD